MSWLMSKGVERHADFLAGTPNWVDPMSRPLCMSRPYESTSVAVHTKITEQSFMFCATKVNPMSRLMCMNRPYESTPAMKKLCND